MKLFGFLFIFNLCVTTTVFAQSNIILKCFIEQTGENPKDKDPIVIVNVNYTHQLWSVVYNTQSGKTIARSETHKMIDVSKGAKLAWEGINLKYPASKMSGQFSFYGNGNYIYSETTPLVRGGLYGQNVTLYLCREQATGN